jgi:hypothetical protein|tara:strand:- start:224 stop:337 length:114 start_codon:yes stop_codon:yes gene_type:complete
VFTEPKYPAIENKIELKRIIPEDSFDYKDESYSEITE